MELTGVLYGMLRMGDEGWLWTASRFDCFGHKLGVVYGYTMGLTSGYAHAHGFMKALMVASQNGDGRQGVGQVLKVDIDVTLAFMFGVGLAEVLVE